jgi:serine/threonine protein kinase
MANGDGSCRIDPLMTIGEMDTERNLLFGLMALRVGIIDSLALIEILRQWSPGRKGALADLLAERGQISADQRAEAEVFQEELVRASGGDVRSAFWSAFLNLPLVVESGAAAAVRETLLAILEESVQRTVIRDEPGNAHTATVHGAERGRGSPAPHELLKSALPAGPRYTRTMLHAAGGMGSVWLARDAAIGRDVALKELRADTVAGSTVPLRFLREARITGQLEHPGIVPVYEIGADPQNGHPYYTMRFVRGRTLTEATREFHDHRRAGHDDPLEFVALLGAFVSVCHTIAYAHSHGIIHRDLKGENIVLGDYGEVIVLDWGLAKRLGADDDGAVEPVGQHAEPGAPVQTMMGQVMGTPAYMAPEQAQGRLDLIGPATDIFGAGAIFYEILAGQPPFAGTSTVEVLQQASQGEIVPPRVFWPDVPPDLEAICLKALSKDPADRHGSAVELARRVQGWQDQQRRQAEDELRQAGKRLMQQQAAVVRLTRSEVFSTPDLAAIFLRMIEAAARTLGVERVGVWRYADDRSAIHLELLYERSTGRTTGGTVLRALDFPDYFAALMTSEVIPADDARTDPRTSCFTESYLNPLNIGAIMDAPIHVRGNLWGVVCHEHVGGARKWMPDEQLFAIAIANLVSQAISLRSQSGGT